LKTVKSNYGKAGQELHIEWRDGVFVEHDATKVSPAQGLLDSRARDVFLELLDVITSQGLNLAASKGANYAPAAMAKHPDSQGINKTQLERAMHRLLADGSIKVIWEGPPSRKRQRLVLSNQAEA
jgi:hypothetical protein